MTQRPNFMLLVAEDTGLHQGCYGNPYADTPDIDRLASEGCRYTRGYTHSPVCAPSRGGLVTGMYPWSLGIHQMRSTLLDPPRLFTHELRDAGYHVGWPTKTDFNFEPPEDFCDSRDNWWEAVPPDGPFFLYRNFGVTHESSVWDTKNPEGNDHAARTAELPDALRHDPAEAPVPPYLADTPNTRREIARYHDALTLQDIRVGQCLDWLDQHGLRDNTVVIYLADHGRGLPREKRWLYDAGVHLPLIVRWPGHIEPGTINEQLIGWVDHAPTWLSLARIDIPGHYQGRVYLGDNRIEPRRYVYSGRDRMDEAFDKVRCVRSKTHLYIRNDFPHIPYAQRNHYMEQELTLHDLRELHTRDGTNDAQAQWLADRKPAEELYDLATDPDSLHNLADNPRQSQTLVALRTELERFLADVGDLGDTTEEDLIAQGLVKDRLEEFRQRIEPLPERYRLGPGIGVLTLREAREQAAALPGV